MEKLPCDIINNILIIKYDEQIKKLKKELSTLKRKLEHTETNNANMLNYLEVHEVKYCEVCDTYGTDDEIILYEEFSEYLCEYCLEFREEEKEQSENN